ncbi:ion transporter [Lewinella sp. W8]|uniref:ion transporter n=1 Tax=Lewinella sp. W8 TaxID=2528208 RepID=UPI001067E232|nr:ion transporter [Lewinella sp. W8]MTB51240.1 ion transporter [Lewinella sp. W8]
MEAPITRKEFRKKVHEVLFETSTPIGRFFDLILLGFIILSMLIVIIETIPTIEKEYRQVLIVLEWMLTIAFTLEYILRIYTANFPWRYVRSFYGVIDLVSIIPTYLGLFLVGSHSLSIIRALRLLRVFRIFKLTKYLSQGKLIIEALKASRTKISVFMFFILLMVCIFGSIMYIIENGEHSGFDSIPRGIYWAIVTLTTVGYGDLSPATPLGQFMASLIMIAGYAVLAVPTGIVTAEMTKVSDAVDAEIAAEEGKECSRCGEVDNKQVAWYCMRCGEKL